jgi:hypothetical protein
VATTDKQQGACSVCLRVIQLRGQSPIRHGFSAIGVRHGAHSGYHTGPCRGQGFPHLGISDEGTRWALEDVRNKLAGVRAALDKLAARPNLTWYPTKYNSNVRKSLPDFSNPVTIKPGDERDYAAGYSRGEATPSYEEYHRRKVGEQETIKHELERAIDTYEKVVATYSPEKYKAIGAPAKVETVHMEMLRGRPGGTGRLAQFMGISCRHVRPWDVPKYKKTNDTRLVTCKACKKTLGLPT